MLRYAVIGLLLCSVACKKKAPDVPEPMVTRDTPTSVPTATTTNTVSVPESVRRMAVNFERVFFELDSDKLSPDAQAALDENSEIMKEHLDIKVEVQGHADERGTTDYNLALGQKRAEAVRNAMIRKGVGQDRVMAVSFGEEKPAVSGASEAAWAQNRRAEFRITWGDSATDTVP